jgi:hypothetical protein
VQQSDRASPCPTLSAVDSLSYLDSVSRNKSITNRYRPQIFTGVGGKVGLIHTVSKNDGQKTLRSTKVIRPSDIQEHFSHTQLKQQNTSIKTAILTMEYWWKVESIESAARNKIG